MQIFVLLNSPSVCEILYKTWSVWNSKMIPLIQTGSSSVLWFIHTSPLLSVDVYSLNSDRNTEVADVWLPVNNYTNKQGLLMCLNKDAVILVHVRPLLSSVLSPLQNHQSEKFNESPEDILHFESANSLGTNTGSRRPQFTLYANQSTFFLWKKSWWSHLSSRSIPCFWSFLTTPPSLHDWRKLSCNIEM